jgi:hypothetical protein
VPWDAWPDMPYELVIACLDRIDAANAPPDDFE